MNTNGIRKMNTIENATRNPKEAVHIIADAMDEIDRLSSVSLTYASDSAKANFAEELADELSEGQPPEWCKTTAAYLYGVAWGLRKAAPANVKLGSA